ncbi:unnamed protein product [Paramecium sonneborni]|uniref:Uncharacterized protein n=1 Tax=Paramecium sonneborni TaxID=65129 RepID=A0A8S1RI73_9CILI|nr:unnamed protein product [Paramecium sonneborni]
MLRIKQHGEVQGMQNINIFQEDCYSILEGYEDNSENQIKNIMSKDVQIGF